MGVKRRNYLSKGLVAARVSALIWLLAGVNPKVLLQGRILRERLSTTFEWTKRRIRRRKKGVFTIFELNALT